MAGDSSGTGRHDDVDERDVCTTELEDEDGNIVVICQQNVGLGNEVGDGEYPDPNAPPKDPGEAAREQAALDNR
jgi:hypothetical protein